VRQISQVIQSVNFYRLQILFFVVIVKLKSRVKKVKCALGDHVIRLSRETRSNWLQEVMMNNDTYSVVDDIRNQFIIGTKKVIIFVIRKLVLDFSISFFNFQKIILQCNSTPRLSVE